MTAMAITPDEIETKVFPLVRRGYEPAAVDDFLKDVATTLAQAQGGLATPPVPEAEATAPEPVAEPAAEPDAVTVRGPDDFGQLGEEVAAILRQAHESVAQLRHRAEADAALIRQNAQREAQELTRRADADRQAAAIELEAARHESDRILADVQRQADGAAAAAAALARQRTQEVIEAARAEARGAVTVQRNVRGRLQDTREHIDLALDRLVEEDTDLFATIDLTDAALAVAAVDDLGPDRGDDSEGPADVPPPGQGPPTPPVPPPSVRTTPESNLDLPYADDDDDDAGTIVVDLTDGRDGGGENGNGDVGGVPAAPADEPDPDDGGGDTADATPPVATTAAGEDEDDALSQMVKNAVENALRRRKGDPEPPPTDPT